MNQQFSVGDTVKFVVNNHKGEWDSDRDNAVSVGTLGEVVCVTGELEDGTSVCVSVSKGEEWWFDVDELELVNSNSADTPSTSTEILRTSTVFNTDVLTVRTAVRIIGHSVEIEGETVEPSRDFECGANCLISGTSLDKIRVVYVDSYGHQQSEYITIDEVDSGLYTIELLK